jgi:elongation factor G
VRGRFIRQSSCPSHFADVVVDFEPAEALTFVSAVVEDDLPAALQPALWRGIRHGLATAADDSPVFVAQVVVRRSSYHPVDASERAYEEAGRLVAAEARARLGL